MSYTQSVGAAISNNPLNCLLKHFQNLGSDINALTTDAKKNTPSRTTLENLHR